MRSLSRRRFISTSGAALGVLPFVRSIDAFAQAVNPVFRHGVASGDPLADRVILWTRVTPPSGVTGAQTVSWELARDEKFARIVTRGELQTGASRDFTVKVDAVDLEPGATYYYRFTANKAQSAIGRTKTLPAAGVNRVRLGVASCSNLPQGYFNAYGGLARRTDLDAVLHLGDYIYEYANAQYGDGTSLGRIPSPNKEILTLQEYRERHAQYKLDADSQEVHRLHPFIVTWDDHEFANNTWWGGAENHTPGSEGDWTLRRAAALQSYYEWMPIREDAQTLTPRIYRTFRFGDLATLFMLDTRLVGRDEQVDRKDLAALASPKRSLLGAAQEDWLGREFGESVRRGTRWNVLGQQVMFAPQAPPDQAVPNEDVWDGYRASQDRMFEMVEQLKVNNFTVLTGDIHSSWGYDLPRHPFSGYDKATGKGSLGVELAGTSVSSPSSLGSGPDGPQQLKRMFETRPHLHYADGTYRGYFVLDLTRERLQADFYGVPTVKERTTQEAFKKGFISESGANHLIEASKPAV